MDSSKGCSPSGEARLSDWQPRWLASSTLTLPSLRLSLPAGVSALLVAARGQEGPGACLHSLARAQHPPVGFFHFMPFEVSSPRRCREAGLRKRIRVGPSLEVSLRVPRPWAKDLRSSSPLERSAPHIRLRTGSFCSTYPVGRLRVTSPLLSTFIAPLTSAGMWSTSCHDSDPMFLD